MTDLNHNSKSINKAESDAERLAAIERTVADGHERRLAYPGDADWLLLGTYPHGDTFAVAYNWPAKGKEDSVLIVSLWVLDQRFVSYDPDTDVLTIPDDPLDDSATRGPGVIPIPDASSTIPRDLLEGLVAPGWSDRNDSD